MEQHQILQLNNEMELPRTFSKILLRRLLSDRTSRGLDDEALVKAYADSMENFGYTLIMARLSDKALTDAGADTKMLALNGRAVRDRIYEFYVSVLSKAYCCFPVIIGGSRVIVAEIQWESSAEEPPYRDAVEDLERFLLEQQQIMQDELGFIAQIIISEPKHDPDNMPDAFWQVLYSVDYVFDIYPGKSVVTFLHSIEKIPNTTNLQPKPEIEQMYFESIIKKDFNLAAGLLRKTIEREASVPSTALSLRLRVHARMDWTLTLLGLPKNRGLPECVAIYDCVTRSERGKTTDELYDCVDDFFHRLEAYYRKVPSDIANKIDIIIRYIKENYADHNLSVSTICEVFGVSASHLSRVFKNKTGIKLIDYIHITRLQEARKLLQKSNLNIGTIAKQVGYAGDWAMIRAFKRLEGATPSSFRSNLKSGDSTGISVD